VATAWKRPPARLRRTYFDCRYGQLHVHQAIPAGGGFDEATALVCLPGARGLGEFFLPVLQQLGIDRSIYAPDLPGLGQSDPPAAGVALARAAADAVLDLLDSLRERRCSLLVHAEGLATAGQLVAQRPGLVQRVAAIGADPAALSRALANSLPAGLPAAPFALLPAGASALPAAPDAAQMADLEAFLGSARPLT
jgi:pimeloyl-ACP methyl ester carboxylesterase